MDRGSSAPREVDNGPFVVHDRMSEVVQGVVSKASERGGRALRGKGRTRMSGLGLPTVIFTMLVAVFVNASDSALFRASPALSRQPQSTSHGESGWQEAGKEERTSLASQRSSPTDSSSTLD